MNRCPECGIQCVLGRMYKRGWDLLSIKSRGNLVEIGSHYENDQIGGHCHPHLVSKKKLLNAIMEKFKK